ncbi:hypothetical protein HY994_05725 [Candidatus Micrarchaeota archaeon]|nr:hypothetical protein [Candidatus Micrarchaeota archaeon]
MATAVVFGASGFAGNELVRLLAFHPEVDGVVAVSREHAGKSVHALYPDSPPNLHVIYDTLTFEQANEADVVFLAIPGPDAKDAAVSLPNVRVIDLSPAHRFDDSFTYGLPEANRDAIKTAKKVANPGCYATACVLAALPLVSGSPSANGPVIHAATHPPAAIAFDCKSGYSGGGKNKQYDYVENVVPYGLNDHYQLPEISKFVKRPFTFAPHVVNAFRGLVATVHVMGLDGSFGTTELLAARFQDYYKNELMVTLTGPLASGDMTTAPNPYPAPTLKSAAFTNGAHIGGFSSDGQNTVLVCAIDNLLKGAASQAVQNMNLMMGWTETDGLLQ